MISACLVVLLCSVGLEHEPPSNITLATAVAEASETDGPTVDFRDFHRTLGWNFTRGLFSTANLVPLAIGGGATLAALPLDDAVTEAVRGQASWIAEPPSDPSLFIELEIQPILGQRIR